MTYVSPLLSSKLSLQAKQQTVNNNVQTNPLNAQRQQHQKYYEDLTKHANDVKPNVAKAKLVKENPIQAFFSDIREDCKDVGNFFKAVKTGNLGDNSLGRINDIGLMGGAALIATYLAAGAKTKTDKIMKFVGGAAFIGAMKLWPKLFINLPARAVHGFDIGQKYINAQGDRKDFFLDNQFLPWDAYSKEEMTQIGKRTGIDINSENGEEKIQRKMQKVALQNRTLWMATAGFATPLMTAMACSFVEPKIQKAVINKNFKKSNDIISAEGGINKYLSEVKTKDSDIKTAEAQLTKLFEGKQSTRLGNDFFSTIAQKFDLVDALKSFSDSDDIKLFENFNSNTAITEELANLYRQKATINPAELKEKLANAQLTVIKEADKSDISKLIPKRGAAKKQWLEQQAQQTQQVIQSALSKEQIESIMNELGENPSIAQVEAAIKKYPIQGSSELVQGLKVNNDGFFAAVKEFSSSVVEPLKARVKAYAKLANPIIGEKSESIYTKEYLDTVSNFFKKAHFSESQIKGMLKENPTSTHSILVQSFFEQLANSSNFEGDMKALYSDIDENVVKSVLGLQEGTKEIININTKDEYSNLLSALVGTRQALDGVNKSYSLPQVLNNSIKINNTNIETFKAKFLISSMFERRVQTGEFEQAVRERLIDKNLPEEEIKETYTKFLQKAREAIHGSSATKGAVRAEIPQNLIEDYADVVFGKENYKNFSSNLSDQAKAGINEALEFMGQHDPNAVNKQVATGASNLSSQIKTQARAMMNNKTWKKIFVPMSIALIAITLLVQPFFGKIDKEYKNSKNGGNK